MTSPLRAASGTRTSCAHSRPRSKHGTTSAVSPVRPLFAAPSFSSRSRFSDNPGHAPPASHAYTPVVRIDERSMGGVPGNHMYADRIRKKDEQEAERLSQAEVTEDVGPARRGPPKEDPPSRSLFRMVSRGRHETHHEHRR